MFESDGVPIHYEVFSQGKPIVLLHGFASNLQGNWVATGWVDTLSPIRRVITLDCRGHGLSGKPYTSRAYAGDQMPDDVLRLMDHLRIEKADLFGYSMGARISLRLLLRHPERFTSVVLGGIGNLLARQMEKGRPNVAEALLAPDPSTITDRTAKGFRVFAEANKNDLKALAAYMRAPRAALDQARLQQVALPVLIVNGEADAQVGSPDELATAIPGARLVKIPERDHITVVPDPRFKETVVHFLTEQSPA